MIDNNEIQKRWQFAWEAKQDELSRIEKASWWLYEFERHLERGEEGHAAYRFPETMGYLLRRYNNFLSVIPEARATMNGDEGLTMQSTLDHFQRVANMTRTRMQALWHTAGYGNSAICVVPNRYTQYDRKKDKWYTKYRGVASEHVDWRHLFPAPGFQNLHDHTGLNQCPWVFRKKIFQIDTFRRIYSDPKYKNVDQVSPTTWGDTNVWYDDKFKKKHETEELTSQKEFVTVLEYYDVENDIYSINASGGIEIYNSPDGIELSHKEFPFHQYRNIQRGDTINGMGEIELNLPYNLFREKIMNLAIDDAMLQVQPALVVDGDINFNPEEHELQSGAIFDVRGPVNGKLQDHIMPLRPGGGITQGVMSMIQMVENSRIAVTSDDTTALYSNPNQLATQTLAKMQTLNKSIDASTKQNIYDAEFYMTRQTLSYIKNELSEPIREDKKIVYPLVKVKGYKAVQNKPDSGVKFVKQQGAIDKFNLNKKITNTFDIDEIEIISAQKDEELKRDQTEKLMMLLQTTMSTLSNLAQTNPSLIQEIFGTMDFSELMKYMAKNLGLGDELQDIFPVIEKTGVELDEIDAEHDLVAAGIVPTIKQGEDSESHYGEHVLFMGSKVFKDLGKQAKEALNKHLEMTVKNIINQKVYVDRKTAQTTDGEEGMGTTQEVSTRRSNPSTGGMVGNSFGGDKPEANQITGDTLAPQNIPQTARPGEQPNPVG
jgi:hypothetical protein